MPQNKARHYSDYPVNQDINDRKNICGDDDDVRRDAFSLPGPRRFDGTALNKDNNDCHDSRCRCNNSDDIQWIFVTPVYRDSDQGQTNADFDKGRRKNVEQLPNGDHLRVKRNAMSALERMGGACDRPLRPQSGLPC